MIIGYFADGPWAHNTLDKLLERKDIKIAFICARSDAPDPILRNMSKSLKVPFLIHNDVNSPEFICELLKYNCDLFVSMSFNQIFKKEIINKPPLGIINCHAGKLPFYRGRNILNWALINDEDEFGITVHYVDEGIDTGDIIRQECFPITDLDDYSTLLRRAHEECANIVISSIEDIVNGKISPKLQSKIHPLGSYCTVRKAGDEKISWEQSSRNIFNFVRAICPPGPSARCKLGNHEIKINRVEFLADAPKYTGIPGSIISREGEYFLIKTLDSYIKLIDWTSDIKLKVGDRLK